MKRIFAVLFCSLLLTGCAVPNTNTTFVASPTPTRAIVTTSPSLSAEPTPMSDESLITITVPKQSEDQDENAIVEAGKQFGCSEVKVNQDGTITYTMTQIIYRQFCENLKYLITGEINYFVENLKSVKQVEYNVDLTEIKLIVTKSTWEENNDFEATSTIATIAQSYFESTGKELTKITIIVIDETTDEILTTEIYP